jgi:hypothetical protein
MKKYSIINQKTIKLFLLLNLNFGMESKNFEQETQRKSSEQETQRKSFEQETQGKSSEQEMQCKSSEQETQRKSSEKETQRKSSEQEMQCKSSEQEMQCKSFEQEMEVIEYKVLQLIDDFADKGGCDSKMFEKIQEIAKQLIKLLDQQEDEKSMAVKFTEDDEKSTTTASTEDYEKSMAIKLTEDDEKSMLTTSKEDDEKSTSIPSITEYNQKSFEKLVHDTFSSYGEYKDFFPPNELMAEIINYLIQYCPKNSHQINKILDKLKDIQSEKKPLPQKFKNNIIFNINNIIYNIKTMVNHVMENPQYLVIFLNFIGK